MSDYNGLESGGGPGRTEATANINGLALSGADEKLNGINRPTTGRVPLSGRHKRTVAIYRKRPKAAQDGVDLSRYWVKERFLSRVDRSAGPNGCWPWKGARSGFGYGRVKIQGHLLSPHRVAWAIANGDLIPDQSYHGGVVMHACDNPVCCNPAHLTLGTARDNARDMSRKGRANKPRGEASPTARLTADVVRQIRESNLSSREASAVFGVNDRYIRSIRRGEVWNDGPATPAFLNGRA